MPIEYLLILSAIAIGFFWLILWVFLKPRIKKLKKTESIGLAFISVVVLILGMFAIFK